MFTKKEVQFESPANGMDHCKDCVHFMGQGRCDIVTGYIKPGDWCDKFQRATVLKTNETKWVDPNKNQTDYVDSSTIDPCTQHTHIVVGGGMVPKDKLKEFSAEGNKREK